LSIGIIGFRFRESFGIIGFRGLCPLKSLDLDLESSREKSF
jgi:hypothetical protein